MKQSYFLKSSMAMLVILSLSTACTKENTQPAPQSTGTGTPYSIDIILNSWAFSDGVFITTFTMPEGADAVYINDKSIYELIGANPISFTVGSYSSYYFMGKLWFNVYDKEAVLSFSNPGNINPGAMLVEVRGAK